MTQSQGKERSIGRLFKDMVRMDNIECAYGLVTVATLTAMLAVGTLPVLAVCATVTGLGWGVTRAIRQDRLFRIGKRVNASLAAS